MTAGSAKRRGRRRAFIICGLLAIGATVAILVRHSAPREARAPLRVCADPNNLPFSNQQQEGFENRLADLLAADLGTRVEYTWWAQRRGFVRSTLDAGLCDVVIGMPREYDLTLTTRPYYRSAYVFVSQRDRHLRLHSLDDNRLGILRIGVQLVGDDFANSPPAHALSARGLTRNIVGYPVLGDYARPNPPARIVEAVARGDVDAALVWGPLAGYFSRQSSVPLAITAVAPDPGGARTFAFDISMAVRRNDAARQRILDDFIIRRQRTVDTILREFGILRTDLPPNTREAS